MIPLKVEQQILAKVKEGKAPACASCGEGGKLTMVSLEGKGGFVSCAYCKKVYKSLRQAWREAWRHAEKRREAQEAN